MDGSDSVLRSDDLWWFNEGSHCRVYDMLGAHLNGNEGTSFAVWAPDAEYVGVIGGFNGWDRYRDPLRPVSTSGIWRGTVREAKQGDLYKYLIRSRYAGRELEKADPLAFFAEAAPKTASIVWSLDYHWSDDAWMEQRRARNLLESPLSVYEVHLPSWRLNPDQGNRQLTYRELAVELADHVLDMGFTHVELMPVVEHPALDSWGYQVTGYFAASSRLGTPQDLMFLVDYLHRRGIGVIIDWPSAHFAVDDHGLALFDGTHLYDHHDDRQGYHPEWDTRIFNYGRKEVRSFLFSAATFWFDKYHADGLRVDAVSSMIYRDFARHEGEWVPNPGGGKENREAVSLLQRLNERVYATFGGADMFAEESTDWLGVTLPVHSGGLGFGFKWDIRWTQDVLRFISRDPVFRRYHQDELTFRLLYYFQENFVLPLSHDEVACNKKSLLHRMPGTDWQKFANLRLLYGYMFAQPGKKLLFMGCEFGQRDEWNAHGSISWHELEERHHAGVARWVRDLNCFYRGEPALYETDCHGMGFEWIDCHDIESSVLSMLRRSKDSRSLVVAVLNFTPVGRENYRVGVPVPGFWKEVLNSDSEYYAGSNCGNAGGVWSRAEGWHDRQHSIVLTIPPLAALILKHMP